MDLKTKLSILADAAKYDASCASSGVKRKTAPGGIGNAEGMGICHSYTPDGRCVSLLKILLTNHCIYDCSYCANRRSSDVPRAVFEACSVRPPVGVTFQVSGLLRFHLSLGNLPTALSLALRAPGLAPCARWPPKAP